MSLDMFDLCLIKSNTFSLYVQCIGVNEDAFLSISTLDRPQSVELWQKDKFQTNFHHVPAV